MDLQEIAHFRLAQALAYVLPTQAFSQWMLPSARPCKTMGAICFSRTGAVTLLLPLADEDHAMLRAAERQLVVCRLTGLVQHGLTGIKRLFTRRRRRGFVARLRRLSAGALTIRLSSSCVSSHARIMDQEKALVSTRRRHPLSLWLGPPHPVYLHHECPPLAPLTPMLESLCAPAKLWSSGVPSGVLACKPSQKPYAKGTP